MLKGLVSRRLFTDYFAETLMLARVLCQRSQKVPLAKGENTIGYVPRGSNKAFDTHTHTRTHASDKTILEASSRSKRGWALR